MLRPVPPHGIAELLPEASTVLLPAGLTDEAAQREFRKRVGATEPVLVMDWGVQYGIVAARPDEDRARIAELASDLLVYPPEVTRPPVFAATDATTIAQYCVDADPGPAANLTLDIRGTVPDSDSHKLLLRRAFAKFATISLTKLSGGKSGGVVWRVEAIDASGRLSVPFVVKADTRKQVIDELAANAEYVVEYVPFPHRPPVLHDRHVQGAREALLVSAFVDRCVRLDEYLEANVATMVIPALFDGPLRVWRAKATISELDVVGAYVTVNVLPSAERINMAWEEALLIDPGVSSPRDLIAMFKKTTRLRVGNAHAHGDLHSRNIFIRKGGYDAILIDFAFAGQSSPLSRDPVWLEVTLMFGMDENEAAKVTEAELNSWYKAPVLRVREEPRTARHEAVQLLRMYAAFHSDETEYDVSVAAHLLKYAKFCGREEAAPRRRYGMAYVLADRIVRLLPRHGIAHCIGEQIGRAFPKGK